MGWLTILALSVGVNACWFHFLRLCGGSGCRKPSRVTPSRRWLGKSAIARRRGEPDAMTIADCHDCAAFADFLILFCRSGLTVPAAFREATLVAAFGRTASCARAVVGRQSLGNSFTDALVAVNAAAAPRGFVEMRDALLFAIDLGASTVPALESLARAFRQEAFTAVEVKVAGASVRMIFPLVFCIFPVLFVLLGAGVVSDLMAFLQG